MLANPDEGRELRRANKSYVFFRIVGLSGENEATGAQGVPLTPQRSIGWARQNISGPTHVPNYSWRSHTNILSKWIWRVVISTWPNGMLLIIPMFSVPWLVITERLETIRQQLPPLGRSITLSRT